MLLGLFLCDRVFRERDQNQFGPDEGRWGLHAQWQKKRLPPNKHKGSIRSLSEEHGVHRMVLIWTESPHIWMWPEMTAFIWGPHSKSEPPVLPCDFLHPFSQLIMPHIISHADSHRAWNQFKSRGVWEQTRLERNVWISIFSHLIKHSCAMWFNKHCTQMGRERGGEGSNKRGRVSRPSRHFC